MNALNRVVRAIWPKGKKWPPAASDDFWYTIPGRQTKAGEEVSPESALMFSAVFSCIKILADSLADLPMVLYEKRGDGKEKAEGRKIFDLMRHAPNDEMSAFRMKSLLQAHLAGWGNCYTFVWRDPMDRIKALYPMNPQTMTPFRSDTGEILYRYRPQEGNERTYSKRNIWHIPGFGYHNLVGKSVVACAAESVGIGVRAEEYAARFYKRDARPSIALKHPGQLGAKARKNLRASLTEEHGGADKAWGVYVLEEGLELETFGIPPADAQFLETRKFQINEICRFYRIPPHMVGDLERATFSNIEHQDLAFLKYSLAPWLGLWAAEANLYFLTPAERKSFCFEFLTENMLRTDIKARSEAYAIGRQWGWLSANDVRKKENESSLGKKGDRYLEPMNMVEAGEEKLPPTPPATPKEEDLDEEVEEQKSWWARRSQTARIRIQKSFVGLFRDTAQTILNRETLAIKRALEQNMGTRTLEDFNKWLDKWYGDLPKYIVRKFRAVMITFADAIQEEANKEIGKDPGMTPELEKFVDDYLGAYANRHVNASLGQLRKLMAETDPEDYREIVEQRADEWTETRADKIALNESVKGASAVAMSVFAYWGIQKLRWVNTGSDVCAYCEGLNNKVVGIEQTFVPEGDYQPSGADAPMAISGPHMHPPLHRGCVCTIVAEG